VVDVKTDDNGKFEAGWSDDEKVAGPDEEK